MVSLPMRPASSFGFTDVSASVSTKNRTFKLLPEWASNGLVILGGGSSEGFRDEWSSVKRVFDVGLREMYE